MKINVILTVVLALNVLFVHSQNSDEESKEELDEEYTESEYQDPPANTYFSERSITTGITEYKVTKTQTCNEQQDFYYEYTGVYECEPVVAESYRVTVNIHMNEPEYDEAKITMKNLASGEVSDFDMNTSKNMRTDSLLLTFQSLISRIKSYSTEPKKHWFGIPNGDIGKSPTSTIRR